jgi:hypothetical protein
VNARLLEELRPIGFALVYRMLRCWANYDSEPGRPANVPR